MAESENTAKSVAPGYPAVESLSELDVEDWEPAAVFQPAQLSRLPLQQGGETGPK